jgi:hypothetical protein
MRILPVIELSFYVIGDYAGDMALEPDDSHEMDMVTLFSSSNHDAEMEAMQIHGILESNGIPSVLVGASTIPSLEFEVQVPKENLEEAQRILAEAQAAGPAAAAEAEAAGEEGA